MGAKVKIGAGSPPIDASVNVYGFVSEDFEGQTRDALKDIGADDFGAFVSQIITVADSVSGLIISALP